MKIWEKIHNYLGAHAIGVIFFLVPIFTLATFITVSVFSTPSFEEIVKLALGSDHVLLSNKNEPVQVLRTDFTKRRLNWFPLEKFSPHLQRIIIETEDQRFYSHPGVDFIALARAAKAIFQGKKIQGASTLTMQLTDLMTPEVLVQNQSIHKKSWGHKIWQLAQALLLELKWSKKQILEAYLNLIHLRGEYQGVPAISYAYFNKHPLALGKYEAVVIASLISAPNQSFHSLRVRSCLLLRRINQKYGKATDQNGCEILSRPLRLIANRPKGTLPMPDEALHLARRLFQDYPHHTVLPSYLNLHIQSTVYSILNKNVSYLRNKNVGNSAAIVIENKSGKVVAYVGATKNSTNFQVDGVQALRQAGSSLKPFIYGRAIEQKILTAASVLIDDPTTISWSEGVYRPTNYSREFFGEVTVREALGSSLNVPAVKVVTMLGLTNTYDLFSELHFSGLRDRDNYGVSMALGAIDVRLDELTNAYRIFANGGKWTPLKWSSVAPEDDNEEAKNKIPSKNIFTDQTAFIISNILADANARSIGFGWNSPLETSFWSAVKTGTSKDYRDNWCIGFSRLYTVGVWAGNFDAEAMHDVSGVTGAGTSWREIMEYLHRSLPSNPPAVPGEIVSKQIRHHWRSHPINEYFLKGTNNVSEVIETTQNKRIQFVFPAEGSVLIKDPQLDPKRIALFVRFKGYVPEKSQMKLDGEVLGEAITPFKLAKPPLGKHRLTIVSPLGHELASIQFSVKGG